MKTAVILGDKIKLNSIDLNRIKDHDNLASKKYVDDSVPNLSNFLTRDEFTDSIDTSNLVTKGSVATINGASIINGGNIEIDSSIYKIVSTLPTENISTEKLYLLKTHQQVHQQKQSMMYGVMLMMSGLMTARLVQLRLT